MTDPGPAGAGGHGRDLAEAALAGDRRALARLLTAVESRGPAAESALRLLHPHAGRAHLVGITGAPGSGKSTLVAALVSEVRRAGRTVAVIAVDPSSPITGGALLGDRVRMGVHAGDDGVFIRSMASRGHAGGLAATTTAAATVLDAVGFDLVLIETVGTGQSEVEVAAAADTTVVLEAPEMGDEIQAIKAGLLEVADLVVVNKGDRPGAGRAAAQLRAMLGQVEVLVTTATTGDGVPALLAALDVHRANGSATAGRAGNRQARAAALVWALLGDRVRELLTGPGTAAATTAALEAVATHSLDPYAAADRLLATLTGRASPAPDPEDAARAAFEALVEAAIAAIPEPFTAELASVAFVVEDEPLPGQAPPGGTLFGLYQGVPRTAWGAASAAHAARITIYRRAHERWYRDPRARARAVAATVRHEVAHHLGISDERLGQLANEHGR